MNYESWLDKSIICNNELRCECLQSTKKTKSKEQIRMGKRKCIFIFFRKGEQRQSNNKKPKNRREQLCDLKVISRRVLHVVWKEEEEEEKEEDRDEVKSKKSTKESGYATPGSERPTRERKTVERYTVSSPDKFPRSSSIKALSIEKVHLIYYFTFWVFGYLPFCFFTVTNQLSNKCWIWSCESLWVSGQRYAAQGHS